MSDHGSWNAHRSKARTGVARSAAGRRNEDACRAEGHQAPHTTAPALHSRPTNRGTRPGPPTLTRRTTPAVACARSAQGRRANKRRRVRALAGPTNYFGGLRLIMTRQLDRSERYVFAAGDRWVPSAGTAHGGRQTSQRDVVQETVRNNKNRGWRWDTGVGSGLSSLSALSPPPPLCTHSTPRVPCVQLQQYGIVSLLGQRGVSVGLIVTRSV